MTRWCTCTFSGFCLAGAGGWMLCMLTASGARADEPAAHGAKHGTPGPIVRPARAATDEEVAFVDLRNAYVARYAPLKREAELAWWEASTTGSEAAFDRRKAADSALVDLHSDGEVFAQLEKLRASGQVKNRLLGRELDVMYRTFLPAQADPALQKRIVALEAELEQIFNTHRGTVDGQPLTENDVRAILAETTNSAKAQAAWTAYVEVGRKVETKLKEVVWLRNQLARSLGYPHFHALKLELQEIDADELFALFAELDELTREPFAKIKSEIDRERAKRFGVAPDDLRPWHYGDIFFQEAPDVAGVDFDAVFQDADLPALCRKYYQSLGMPCDDVLERSDLYEKPGKSPHAFCTDIDRSGDIRVLCNLKPNAYWADTLMHELGHAVYDKYIDRKLSFPLRKASHAITTEGVANMLGALTKNADWLVQVRGLDPQEAAPIVRAAAERLRREKIIFARWTQVMVHFEHALYTQPEQDLSKLWWDLKQRYQLLNHPEDLSLPGYGAKNHVVTVPVYYHSYLMGDLFAAQLHTYIARQVLGVKNPADTSFYGKPLAGEYLKTAVFGPGLSRHWDELTQRATGEPLSAKYFVQRFVD